MPLKPALTKKRKKQSFFSGNSPLILQNNYSVSTENVYKEGSEMLKNKDTSFASSKTKET